MNKLNQTIPVIATMAVSGWLTSCGTKEDKSSKAEKTPSVEITGIQQQAGGNQLITYKADSTDVSYECKVETTASIGQWQACDASGLQVKPAEGTILVSVRAKRGETLSVVATKLISAPAPQPSASPSAQPSQLQAVIAEKSNPQSAELQNGEVQISFTALGAQAHEVRFECKIGDLGQFEACQSPLKVQRLVSGQIPSISVRPVKIATGEVGLVDTIMFNQANLPQRDVPTEMMIGQYYKFTVPQGMHVNEYSSNANVNGVVDQYRIRTESDPYYIGNTQCRNDSDSDFLAISPSGQPLKYCNSTSQDQVFKFFTDNRWAYNHLAVGTDAATVDRNPYMNEHFIINLFDGNPEVRRSHTKFWDLCRNAIGGQIDVVPAITMMWNFWGERVRANFWMCTTTLTLRQPNGLPTYATFRVGSFFITNIDTASSQVLSLPDMRCTDCSWRYPHLMEVVYVSRTNDNNVTPGFFAQTAQRKFEQNLSPINY
jgi:hypothetical protein